MKRFFLLFSLLMSVAIVSADNYTVAVNESETIYCTATAPANGWITHAFFTLTNARDAEYLSIENHASDLYAIITGLKPKTNIQVQVTYCYSYVGSYDQDIHVGSAVYYDYITVTGSSEGTTFTIKFYSNEYGYSDVQPQIAGDNSFLYLYIGDNPVNTNNITSYGFLMGFGDPNAFEITLEPNKLYITIETKREAWAYLVCEVGDNMGLCKLVANSHLYNEDGINYRCFAEGYAYVHNKYTLDGDIVIPSSICENDNEYIVTEIEDWAFNGAMVNSVTIPGSVNRIGAYAFNNCQCMTSVNIPNSVREIGENAFAYCYLLDSIRIPQNITTIKPYTFYNCRRLQKVIIPSSITTIENHAFYDCWSLISLNIPNSVTSIASDAFYHVPNIIYYGTATGSPWGASNKNAVVDGWLIFTDSTKTNISRCSLAADSVVIPNSVTTISDRAFVNCYHLSSLTIPSHVSTIGTNAFYLVAHVIYEGSATGAPWGARSLNGYVEGDFVYNDVSKTKILACFSKCTGDVVIPESVTSIGEFAFTECSKITSITIPDNVLSIERLAFGGCRRLHHAYIGKGITEIKEQTFSGCRTLNYVSLPDGITKCGDRAFYNCWLESFIISAKNPPIITSTLSFYFGGTNSWRTLYVPQSSLYDYRTSIWKRDFPNIEAIPDSVLYSGACGAYSLWEITTDSILYIRGRGYMTDYSTLPPWHSHRDLIKEVRISDEILSIGDKAFYQCSEIKSIDMPNTIKQIGNSAFHGCSSLSSISIPKRLTNICDSAFYDCSALSKVNVPDLYTWCKISFASYSANPLSYAHHLYLDNIEITSVEIPSTIDKIANYCFSGASSICSVYVHDSITQIGEGAFVDCSALTSIVIPNNLTIIGDHAFRNCISLNEVTNYALTPQEINRTVFEGVNTNTCKLYVHSKSVKLYKQAEGWKDFSHTIALETDDNISIIKNDNDGRNTQVRKVFINGQIVIIKHDGSCYKVTGEKL